MRFIIIVIMVLPFWSFAQINRSANELANEKVLGFLSAKLFKGQSLGSVEHGQLKPYKGPDESVTWFIVYKLLSNPLLKSESENPKEPFYFIFYLDKKLNVLLAESYNNTAERTSAKEENHLQ